MTKDKLKKEAEDYAEQCYGWTNNDQVTDVAIATYITSAEPREKRIADLEKENTELKEELKKWKDEWQEQVQKAIDEGYARTLQTIQLTKAIELLKWALHSDPEHDNLVDFDTKWKEAEQFLKEIEK